MTEVEQARKAGRMERRGSSALATSSGSDSLFEEVHFSHEDYRRCCNVVPKEVSTSFPVVASLVQSFSGESIC